jgi:hypothetical protein
MKKYLFSFIFISYGILAYGQNIVGRVNNKQGKPIAFAFVADVKNKTATYTDSTGVFYLTVMPGAMLNVNAHNYTDTVINVSDHSNLNITLNGEGSVGKTTKIQTSSVNNYDTFGSRINTMTAGTNAVAVTSHQDATQGSRYLFDYWAHGYVISAADSIVQNTHYLFNYDKISGALFLNKDDNTTLQVAPGQIKSFVLFDTKAKPYYFEKAPGIDESRYVQVLSEGKKYKIYKALNTKFIKANYSTNGLSSSGNNFDEYVDQPNYYVVKSDGKAIKLLPKKKAIKEVFADDSDKLSKFMSTENGDIDDTYLTDLGDFLNK